MNSVSFRLREYSVPLVLGIIAALVWVNISPQSYHQAMTHRFLFGHHFQFLINDIFMVFFFAMAGVHIIESFTPGGAFYPLRKAVNPLMATAGGVLGPVVFYLVLNCIVGSRALMNGWGIPTATDIALAWLIARFIFGKEHVAVKYLLLLAITDDAIGLGIIAIFYPDPLYPVRPVWLLLLLVGMAVAFVLRKIKVLNYWGYLLTAGILCWLGLYQSGLHPALAVVLILPFFPYSMRLRGSTLSKFQRDWAGIVDFGLFFFGLANAGVELSRVDTVTWLVFLSLLIGKSTGIYLFSNIAKRLGYPLPTGMGQRHLVVLGLIGGIGLTVSLFVASGAFVQADIQSAAKMGALLSINAAVIAFMVSKVLHVKRSK